MDININDYLRINVEEMIMVLISTFLIVLICKKFFWNYLKDYLAKREQFIQSQLDESASRLQESELLKQEYEKKISNAKDEAKSIIDSAQANAKREADEIISNAKKEATATKEKAAQDIKYEQEKAKKEMHKQISDVSFAIAHKIIKDDVDEKTHQKYVDEFINEAGDDQCQA